MAYPLDNHRSDVNMFATVVEPRAAGECFRYSFAIKPPENSIVWFLQKDQNFLAFWRHFNVKKSIDHGKLLYVFFFYNKIDS